MKTMVPSQFLSVVLEEDDGHFSEEERNHYSHRPSWQNQYSVHSNSSISDQEMWNLTKNLPKALLAECTVEISRTPAKQNEKVRKPCFDARVSPVFNRPAPPVIASPRVVNPTVQQFLPPPPQLLHRSEWLEERMDIQDLLSGVEAVYSDNESDGEPEEAASVSIFPITVAKIEKTKPEKVKKQDINKFSYPCEHCPNVYSNRGALWQHSVATHSVEKTCECKICGRKFYRNCSLALHLKSHSEEEYCQCKECGKSFNRLANLERHMRVHTEAEQYPCPSCDKVFRDKTNLLRHAATHTMPKQFQCDICNKGFKSQESLDVHQQSSHATVDTSLACATCGDVFSSFAELMRHDITHSSEKHLCKICGAIFTDKSAFKNHMATHTQTGERLTCTLCGIDFTQKSSLLRHVKRMHQGEGCDPSLLDEKSSNVDSSENGSVQDMEEETENESNTVEIRKALGSPVKSGAISIEHHKLIDNHISSVDGRSATVKGIEISVVTNKNQPEIKYNGNSCKNMMNGKDELTITMESNESEMDTQNEDETDSQTENGDETGPQTENGVQSGDETSSPTENLEENGDETEEEVSNKTVQSATAETKQHMKLENNDPLSSVDINTMHTAALKLET